MLDHVDARGRGSRERARILDTRNVTETTRTNRSGIYAWFTKHEHAHSMFEKIDRLKIRWEFNGRSRHARNGVDVDLAQRPLLGTRKNGPAPRDLSSEMPVWCFRAATGAIA